MISHDKRDKYLRMTYGISIEVYGLMLKHQGGGCAICRKPPKPGKNLHVDHDHGPSKRVRGLLCHWCNRKILGRRREDPDIHDRAAAYLRQIFDWRHCTKASKAAPPQKRKTRKKARRATAI